MGAGQAIGRADVDDCVTGRGRVAAVCAHRRQIDRRPARPQPGADGARHCQFRHSAFWRHSCNRHDRAHCDKREERRSEPDRGHHPRADATRHSVDRRSARGPHPVGGAGGDPDAGRVEHGRVARVRTPEKLSNHLSNDSAGDVLSYRHLRYHGGGRSRPDTRQPVFHLPDLADHTHRAHPACAGRGGPRR